MWVRSALARPVPAAITTAIVLLPVLVVMAMVSTATDAPQPIDYGLFGPAGAELLTGHWSAIFGDPLIQAGPLELLPWGVIQLLGVSGQVGWTVATTCCSALTAFLAALVLRPTLSPDLRSSALAAGGTLVLSLAGPVAISWNVGHPSEVLVPLLWVVAGRLALRNRPMLAAGLVAASSGFEVWGLLGAPVVLLAADLRLLRPALVGVAVLAVLWVPFVVAGPFHMFSFAWSVSDRSLIHLLQPSATSAPWSYRLVQGLLALGGGSAVALLLRGAAWGPWAVVVAVVAGRLVLDPVLAAYYWDPVLVGLVGALALAVRRRAVVPAVVVATCLAISGVPNGPVVRAAVLLAIAVAASALVRLRRETARPCLRRSTAAA
jgi:hypothetical protein